MTEKICSICHESCADRPRIKDGHGHYYCRGCYDDAMARKRVRASGDEPPTAAPTAPATDGFSMLAEAIVDEARVAPPADQLPCPNCQAPITKGSILCVSCGYNLRERTRAATATVKRGVTGEASSPSGHFEMLLGPTAVGLGVTVLFGLLFGLVMSDTGMVAAFVVPYQIYSLVFWVVTIVAAFREGIGQGFLTLCLPFYAIYFIFGVNENGHLKAAFLANLAAAIMFVVLISSIGMSATDLPWRP